MNEWTFWKYEKKYVKIFERLSWDVCEILFFFFSVVVSFSHCPCCICVCLSVIWLLYLVAGCYVCFYLNFKDKLDSHKRHVLLVICVFTLYLHGIPRFPLVLQKLPIRKSTAAWPNRSKSVCVCVCIFMCEVGILDCKLFSGQGLMWLVKFTT